MKMIKKAREKYRPSRIQLLCDAMMVVLILIAVFYLPRLHAFDLMDGRWEGVWFEPGATVNLTLHPDLCIPERVPMMEWGIDHMMFMMNLADQNDRSFNYLGQQPGVGWGNWGDDYDPATKTVNGSGECGDYNKQQYGGAVPIQLNEGKIVDFAFWFSTRNLLPLSRVNELTTHELGHAMLTQRHSNVPGSNMTVVDFDTDFAAQIRETWTIDFLCGLEAKYAEIGEEMNPAVWYVAQADDLAHIRHNFLHWQGQDYQAFSLHDGVDQWAFHPGSIKSIPNCEDLAQ